MDVPRLHFTNSKNYSAPIHPNLLNELRERGWKLIKEIGRGNTNVAFLAENNHIQSTVLIPTAQEYTDKNINHIIKLQKEGKLLDVVEVYDWFYTESVVDKEELKIAIENEIVTYPDYVFNDGGYNIFIIELLTPLTDYVNIDNIEQTLTSLYKDAWVQTDLHLGNFGYSATNKLKVFDLEGLMENDDFTSFTRFINKLKTNKL